MCVLIFSNNFVGWDGIIPTCISEGHVHRVAYTRCRIDTINSPDDGHKTARNMEKMEINIDEKMRVKLVIYKDYKRVEE